MRSFQGVSIAFNLWSSMLEVFSTSCKVFFNTISRCVWYVPMRMWGLADSFKYFKIIYDDFTCFCVLQIMHENYYYYEKLIKIRTFVKYLIDAFYGFILPRYTCRCVSGNINSHDYHSDSFHAMFPWFPNCFLRFPLVFRHVSLGVSTVS